MRTLLDDPGLRESLARSAAKRVERFSVGRMLEDTEALYERILAGVDP